LEDDNVISTPLHSEDDDPIFEPKGPYYVPWKKSSMDAHNKYFVNKIYKNSNGYIPNSTLGNIPTNKDEKSN